MQCEDRINETICLNYGSSIFDANCTNRNYGNFINESADWSCEFIVLYPAIKVYDYAIECNKSRRCILKYKLLINDKKNENNKKEHEKEDKNDNEVENDEEEIKMPNQISLSFLIAFIFVNFISIILYLIVLVVYNKSKSRYFSNRWSTRDPVRFDILTNECFMIINRLSCYCRSSKNKEEDA